jgi:hypothetical protein
VIFLRYGFDDAREVVATACSRQPLGDRGHLMRRVALLTVMLLSLGDCGLFAPSVRAQETKALVTMWFFGDWAVSERKVCWEYWSDKFTIPSNIRNIIVCGDDAKKDLESRCRRSDDDCRQKFLDETQAKGKQFLVSFDELEHVSTMIWNSHLWVPIPRNCIMGANKFFSCEKRPFLEQLSRWWQQH